MTLPPGKIPIRILKDIVFKHLGATRKEVILGPTAGIDGAVLDMGDESLIVSMDPITGAVERIGWLAVNVNANDIATFGVKPTFLFSSILLPENSDKKIVETICQQMDVATKELGIAIVGGHCESTLGLTCPIVVCCIMGMTEKKQYVTAGGAKPSDKLILTKSAGIEGTAILASDKELELKKTIPAVTLKKAKNFYSQISVVKEAMIAFRTGDVHAMHDPTEGGVLLGIHEMADASGLGVKIFKREISVRAETKEICRYFGINPLKLISSGALLISAGEESAHTILKKLKKEGIQASVIGEFLEDKKQRLFVSEKGKTQKLSRPLSDHLWKALCRQEAT